MNRNASNIADWKHYWTNFNSSLYIQILIKKHGRIHYPES